VNATVPAEVRAERIGEMARAIVRNIDRGKKLGTATPVADLVRHVDDLAIAVSSLSDIVVELARSQS
jgi:hypothetical protein